MLLTYFLNDFEMVPDAPIITGITFVFTFHMRCICILRSLYFRIFSAFVIIIIISSSSSSSSSSRIVVVVVVVVMFICLALPVTGHLSVDSTS
jgi:hypothetical protein